MRWGDSPAVLPTEPTGRRPLKTRDWPFFKNLAAWLARLGVTPNAISVASIGFACAAGLSLVTTSLLDVSEQRGYWLLAAAFIQLRLIANLLDGMVAVEGGKGGPTGDLWNEAPDRISDAAIFIGAGCAATGGPLLGWAAALIAVFVAYVRALGASVGAGQIVLGPMAKPHRMAVMTFACVLLAIFPVTSKTSIHQRLVDLYVRRADYVFSSLEWNTIILPLALVLVIVGGLITAIRRLRAIAKFLCSRSTIAS